MGDGVDNAVTPQVVEYRPACRDCRDGLGEWGDSRGLAAVMAREHAHRTGHATTVQTCRTVLDDDHTPTGGLQR